MGKIVVWQFVSLVIGIGKRMFDDVGRNISLRLVDTLPVGPDGVVVNTYAPA